MRNHHICAAQGQRETSAISRAYWQPRISPDSVAYATLSSSNARRGQALYFPSCVLELPGVLRLSQATRRLTDLIKKHIRDFTEVSQGQFTVASSSETRVDQVNASTQRYAVLYLAVFCQISIRAAHDVHERLPPAKRKTSHIRLRVSSASHLAPDHTTAARGPSNQNACELAFPKDDAYVLNLDDSCARRLLLNAAELYDQNSRVSTQICIDRKSY